MKSSKQRFVERLENRNLLSVSCGDLGDNDVKMEVDLSGLLAPTSITAADNSFREATNLGSIVKDIRVRGSIGGYDRADYFKLSVPAQGELQLDTNLRSFGARLQLFDQNFRIVESDFSYGSSRLQFNHDVAPGDYYVSVSTFSFRGSRYQLDVGMEVDRTVPNDRAGNTLSSAVDLGRLEGSRTYHDYVGTEDKADVYHFDVDRSAQLDVDLTGLRSDIDVYLLDSNGRVLTRSDNAGAQAESIRGRLSAGHYYIAVAPYQSNGSNYQLTIRADLDAPQTQPTTPVTSPGGSSPGTTAPDTTAPDTTAPDSWEPLPNVGYFGGNNEWNLNAINAPESWAAGFTGEGTVVAVVDTGVDLDHIDLDANIWRNDDEIAGDGIDNDRNGYVDDVRGWNFIAGNNTPNDRNGHGTHVAGTIAAERNGIGATGVAYNAEIMPVKVLGNDGAGSDYSVASGIRYAVDNGADVINLSLGSSGNSRVIQSALNYALSNNVFVVAASGNESSSIPAYPAIHSRELDNVLSVGAFDSRGNSAGFSNKVGNSRATQVEAPGVSIYSTLPDNRVGRLSGTSMAAPHVAGIAALALSARPDLTVVDMKSLLAEGADLNVNRSDSIGAVNAANSVARARLSTTLQSSTAAANTARQSGVRYRASTGTAPSRFSLHRVGADNLNFMPIADPTEIFVDAEGAKTDSHKLNGEGADLELYVFGKVAFRSNEATADPSADLTDELFEATDQFFGEFEVESLI